eukprot:Pgem_evm1s1059
MDCPVDQITENSNRFSDDCGQAMEADSDGVGESFDQFSAHYETLRNFHVFSNQFFPWLDSTNENWYNKTEYRFNLQLFYKDNNTGK